MARNTVKAELLQAEEIIDVDLGQRPVTSAEEQADEWADFLASGGEAATVFVYRQPGNGQTALEFVDSFPADQFQPDALLKRLRNEFGGGNYRIQIRSGGRVRQNKLLAVAAPSNQLATVQRGGDPVTMALLEEIRAMRQEMKATESKSAIDQIKELGVIAGAMREMFGPPAQRSAIGELKELLTLQSELRGLFGGEEPADSGMGIGKVLAENLPGLLNLATAAMAKGPGQKPARPMPQRRRPVDVTPGAEAPKVNPAAREEKPVMNQMMVKKIAAALLPHAKNGDDPGDVAEGLLQEIPEMYLPMLTEQLKRPDLLDVICCNVPEAAPYREWVSDVIEWLKG